MAPWLIALLLQGMMGTFPLPRMVGTSEAQAAPRPVVVAPDAETTMHPVPVAKFAAVRWTHVCTTGVVTLKRYQADGDWHLRITDGTAFIVAEVVPQIPLALPKKGQRVRVCGVRRYDDGHGWWEVHPVTRRIEVLR